MATWHTRDMAIQQMCFAPCPPKLGTDLYGRAHFPASGSHEEKGTARMRETMIAPPKVPALFLAANSLAGTLFTGVSCRCLLVSSDEKYQRAPLAAYIR